MLSFWNAPKGTAASHALARHAAPGRHRDLLLRQAVGSCSGGWPWQAWPSLLAPPATPAPHACLPASLTRPTLPARMPALWPLCPASWSPLQPRPAPPPRLPAPAQDHAALLDAGVAAFYGPGTRVPAAALDMIGMLLEEPELAQIG